jgi:glycosyltransferase involved in cell wall biosynthesis
MPGRAVMTLAVVVKGYPRLSETFIAQELLGLERRGIDLRIVSLRHPTDRARHPIHGEIAAPVTYLPEYLWHEPRRCLRAWLRARRLPGYRGARTAFLADLRRDPTPNRIRRFGQACVLAAELGGTISALHAHFLHTPGSVARYAARLLGLPFSLSGHAKDIWTTPDWDLGDKLRDAAWTVTCSEAAAARLRTLAPDRPVEVIYHGLDLGRFPPHPRRHSGRDGSDAKDPARILAVSRAVEKKGLDLLLDALAALPPQAHWRLTHIGGGVALPALRRQAEALGIAGRIVWLGAQPQTVVLAALREADLFVAPSRIAADGDRDGLPNVLMEAQSQALPVVASRVSAIPELVADGETGLLGPPGDRDALAAALRRLIGDPALRRRLGDAGERRVHARFDCAPWLDRLAARFAMHRIRRPGDARAA